MSPRRRLVLASASPARLGLLRAAGFAPQVVVSGVDEDAIGAETLSELVVALAEAKATTVAALAASADAIVIGCDSLLDVDAVAHGKPRSIDEARARLQHLRGRAAVLRTGHCLIDTRSGRSARGVASTTVHFAAFTDTELEAYLATGEPMAVAGAFTLDGRSAPFIDRIEGDHGTVIGLSMPLLRTLLGQLDVQIMDMWT
jgi:septum formation protein